MKKKFTIIAIVCASVSALSQSVGINNSTPHPSAMLDVKSNTTHKTITLPHVFLSDITDVSDINGGVPAPSLLVYNTNPDLPGGKGVFYWDAGTSQWQFLVTQGNIELFRNLTKYYTAKSSVAVPVSTTASGAVAYTLGSGTAGWTLLKNSSNNDLTANISAEHTQNFLEINLTGTWFFSSSSPLDFSYDVAYGIFVDDQLRFVKTETKTADAVCNYTNFYVNANVQNVTMGAHNVKFGVRLRRIRNTNNNAVSLPTGTTLNVGGGNTTCGVNAFNSETRATVYVNQTI